MLFIIKNNYYIIQIEFIQRKNNIMIHIQTNYNLFV